MYQVVIRVHFAFVMTDRSALARKNEFDLPKMDRVLLVTNRIVHFVVCYVVFVFFDQLTIRSAFLLPDHLMLALVPHMPPRPTDEIAWVVVSDHILFVVPRIALVTICNDVGLLVTHHVVLLAAGCVALVLADYVAVVLTGDVVVVLR